MYRFREIGVTCFDVIDVIVNKLHASTVTNVYPKCTIKIHRHNFNI